MSGIIDPNHFRYEDLLIGYAADYCSNATSESYAYRDRVLYTQCGVAQVSEAIGALNVRWVLGGIDGETYGILLETLFVWRTFLQNILFGLIDEGSVYGQKTN